LLRLLVVVPIIIIMAMTVQISMAQLYSDGDTMRVVGVDGIPGDTVSLPFYLFNDFHVGGFQLRVSYDINTFAPVSMTLAPRAQSFELYGANFSQPGIITFAATSWDPRINAISPGSGTIVDLKLAIRNQAVPDSYLVKFEDPDSSSHQNALSNTRGDSLVVPVLDVRFVRVFPGAGISEGEMLPQYVALEQNYPNPFNGSTVISFTLSEPQVVDLIVYDILGEQVTTLLSGLMPAGETSITWNGIDDHGRVLVSGIYLYRLKEVGGRTLTQKMTLLK